jgi:hypothetical protein
MATRKEDWLRRRAEELWNAEGRPPDREQDCWDKAVQEYEAGTSEAERSQVNPDPAVGSGSAPTTKR